MSMQYIRSHYGVPAKRGGRVRFTDSDGRVFHCIIRSASGAYLRVSTDAPITGRQRVKILHPTWNVEYL